MKHQVHDIEIDLPLYPTQAINKPGLHNVKVVIDGHEMKGVEGLTVHSGSNGFTNVVLELCANVQLNSEAVAVINLHDDTETYFERKMGPLMREALKQHNVKFDMDPDEMGSLARSFLELMIAER